MNYYACLSLSLSEWFEQTLQAERKRAIVYLCKYQVTKATASLEDFLSRFLSNSLVFGCFCCTNQREEVLRSKGDCEKRVLITKTLASYNVLVSKLFSNWIVIRLHSFVYLMARQFAGLKAYFFEIIKHSLSMHSKALPAIVSLKIFNFEPQKIAQIKPKMDVLTLDLHLFTRKV